MGSPLKGSSNSCFQGIVGGKNTYPDPLSNITIK
jgi:hypothetical protein